jgi:Hypothetical glycosyl hydrolase 6/Beta-galactosidase trimerisation domain
MNSWNNNKICRVATGWPIADVDQIENEADFAVVERIVNFNLNAKELAVTLAEAGVEVFCYHATSHSGNVWFNSKVAKKITALGERDLVQELTDECGKLGIESTCLMQVVCNQRAHDEHPQWRQINSEGNACDVSPRVCFNNPQYRKHFLTLVEEVASYKIKAILIDEFDFNGRHGGGLMCYCEHCQALFAKKFGGEMSRKEDWDDPQWINFIRFRFDSLTNFIKDVKNVLLQTAPEVMLSIISYSGIWVDWKRLQPIEDFSKYLDFFCLDAEGILNSPILARLFCAYSAEKAEIMGASTSTFGQLIKEPETELKGKCASISEVMTVLSHNLSWNMDIGYKPLPEKQIISKDIFDFYSIGTKEINKRRQWVQGKQQSLAQIAIFYSEKSKIFYGRDNISLYCDEFMGYFEVLLNSGNIFDLIGTKHLNENDLYKYKLLILPAAACLSDAETECLRKYVAGGGKIIASYNTSLCDSYGGKRDDFALSDVFGCSYEAGIPDEDYSLREKYQQIRNKELEYGFFRHCSFDEEVAGYAIPIPVITVKNHAGKLRGEIFSSKPGIKTYCPGFVNSVTFSDDASPLMIENKFGKGAAIYIGAKFGALYAEAAPGFVRHVILEEINNLLKDELDIKVTAPSCIEVTAFKQTENRIVIHLNNRQTVPDRFDLGFLLAPSMYEAENVLPVHNIEVELRNLNLDDIVKSYMAPEMLNVELKPAEAGKLTVKLPEIKHHSMLVIETT